MCEAKLADFTQEERENAAKMNNHAVNELITGKRFVEVRDDDVPRQSSEKGLPLLGGNVFMARSDSPNRDDATGQTC
ncbi:hypothetical protein ACDW82_01600 [Alcaligenes faecalis]|uniref:hypothetical protein n=1 Tax=Alcaligenes faecalis TaxID=511 RepID=UPI0035576A85